MIKAVIFDVDGVLIDSFEANLKFFQELMKEVGYPEPTREQYQKMYHMNMKDVIKELTRLDSEDEIHKIWLFGKEGPIRSDASLVKTPADLVETIKKLSENYKLGVATSRVGQRFLYYGDLPKVKKYFEAVVSYEDTDKHKPDPEPLLLCAKQLEAEPSNCIYVGDNESDISAARAAGMKIIIYSKTKFSDIDEWTDKFEEIYELIKKNQNA